MKPQVRNDAGRPRRIPEGVVQKAIALREEVPSRSAGTIIEILRRDPEVPSDLRLIPRTLRGILNRRCKSREALDRQAKAFKRFERDEANSLWPRYIQVTRCIGAGRGICSWVRICPTLTGRASTAARHYSASSTTTPG